MLRRAPSRSVYVAKTTRSARSVGASAVANPARRHYSASLQVPELTEQNFTPSLYEKPNPVVCVVYDRSSLSDEVGVKVAKWQKLMEGWRLNFVKIERKGDKEADGENKDLIRRLQADHVNLPILFSYWKGVPLFALKAKDAVDEKKLEAWLKLINNYM